MYPLKFPGVNRRLPGFPLQNTFDMRVINKIGFTVVMRYELLFVLNIRPEYSRTVRRIIWVRGRLEIGLSTELYL